MAAVRTGEEQGLGQEQKPHRCHAGWEPGLGVLLWLREPAHTSATGTVLVPGAPVESHSPVPPTSSQGYAWFGYQQHLGIGTTGSSGRGPTLSKLQVTRPLARARAGSSAALVRCFTRAFGGGSLLKTGPGKRTPSGHFNHQWCQWRRHWICSNCYFLRKKSCPRRKIELDLGLKKQFEKLFYSESAKKHKSRYRSDVLQHAVPDEVLQCGFSSYKGETNVNSSSQTQTRFALKLHNKNKLKNGSQTELCSSTASFLVSLLPASSPYQKRWPGKMNSSYSYSCCIQALGK